MVDDIIKEDAKSDWLKLVKKHKRKQTGYTTLNPNAGNVEKSIELFNMTQPGGSVSVDACNGNTAIAESITEKFIDLKEDMPMNTITLEYSKLPIDLPTKGRRGGVYDYNMGTWVPDDGFKELYVFWQYDADLDAVVDFLSELDEVKYEYKYDTLPEQKYVDSIYDNVEELATRYNNLLLAHFRDDAIADAEEHYDDEEGMYEEVSTRKSKFDKSELDDNFDMSMRTLL